MKIQYTKYKEIDRSTAEGGRLASVRDPILFGCGRKSEAS